MPVYSVTLNASQDDALQFLTERARAEPGKQNLTAQAMLQTFMSEALYATEVQIAAALESVLAAGYALPDVVRKRMTATLSAQQLAQLAHLKQPPKKERKSE